MMPYTTRRIPGAGLLVSPMSGTAPFSAVLALAQAVVIVPASGAAACGGVEVLSHAQVGSLLSGLGGQGSRIHDWAMRRSPSPLDLGEWRLERCDGFVEMSNRDLRLRFDSEFGCHASDMEVFLDVLRLAMDPGS